MRYWPGWSTRHQTWLDGRAHYPDKIQLSRGIYWKNAPSNPCIACTAKWFRHESRYMCETCDSKPAYYISLRKTLKWYRKVVLHFVDMVVILVTNSFLVYKSQGERNHHVWYYRRELIKSLVSPTIPTPRRCTKRSNVRHKTSDMSRLDGRAHYPDKISLSGGIHQKNAPSKPCVVCTAKGFRHESCYTCATCVRLVIASIMYCAVL